jgi:hypothetical protein
MFSGVTWFEIKTESTKIIDVPLPEQDMEIEKAAEDESDSTCCRTWFHETPDPVLERELV